ncbi:MAG: hypothetical protein M5R36_12715 [Deltaproteobacteria bacterium]|nr:hypothetical protein [Deltaproteobacteria bacterium]
MGRRAHAAFRESEAESLGLAVIGTGSLGRREMSPWSDVDFILLAPDGVANETLESAAEAMLYPLWDAGVTTGHQVRRIDDAIGLAEKDAQALTGLLDARLIAGDEAFARTLDEQTDALLKKIGPSVRIYRPEPPAVSADYPPAVHVLEPDIKESPGGLRDFHVAVWSALARFGRGGDPAQTFIDAGFISRVGWLELTQAVDFLLRLRHETQFRARSRSDKLSVAVQPEAAILLGYQGAGEAEAARRCSRITSRPRTA